MEEIERQILELITQAYDTIGWPGVIGLMAIESVFFPLPSEVIMPLAGFEARGQSVWLVFLIGFYGAVGSLLGALLIYAVGAVGGRPLLERYGRYLLITENDLNLADRLFERYGTWAVFLSRMVPVARSLISLPAGVVRMPLLPFTLLTFAGSFIWSLGLAFGGYLIGDNWDVLRNAIRPFDIPMLIAVVAVVAFYVYRRLRSRRRESQQEQQP